MVRQLLREGSFARRIEDKYAVGSLDMLIVTPLYTIYTEAKLLNNIAALPASVAQRHQIELVNRVGNAFSRALVVGLKDGRMGFGLPGERWDDTHTARLATTIDNRLTDIFHVAVQSIWPNPRAYPPPG